MAAGGGKAPAKIRAINKATVHRICSGQVVLDLATAVKELIENSLDAGATTIDIRLKESGAEMVEVSDNGCGVSPDSFRGLALKYHTSKISEFGDLQKLSSFGFRGEALSSLCALAEVTIVTRTEHEKLGTRLVYDHLGSIVSQVLVTGQVVREGENFSPVSFLVVIFCLTSDAELWATGKCSTTSRNHGFSWKAVFHLACAQQGLHTQHPAGACSTLVGVAVLRCYCKGGSPYLLESDSVEGFVSKPGYSSGKACQLFYVNGRPVDMPKFSKLLNDIYKSFNSQRPPMAVLNFILAASAYDVNVTPDKRKVFIHAEGALLAALRQQLEAVYSADEHTYVVHNTPDEKPREDIPLRVGGKGESQRMGSAKESTFRGQTSADDVATAEELDSDEYDGSQGNGSDGKERKAFLHQAASFSFTRAKSPLVSKPLREDLATCEDDKSEDEDDGDVNRGATDFRFTRAKPSVSKHSSEPLATDGYDKPDGDENNDDKRREFLQHTASLSFTKVQSPIIKPGSVSSLAASSKAMNGSNLKAIRRCSERHLNSVKLGTPAPQAPKIVQSSLSTFLSRQKRPSESDEALLSEQPVLKCMYYAKQGRQDGKVMAINLSDGQGQMVPGFGLSGASMECEPETGTNSFCCRDVTGDEDASASLGDSAPSRQQDALVIDQPESRNTGTAGICGGEKVLDASVGEKYGANQEPEGLKYYMTVDFSFKKFQLKSRFRLLQHGVDKAQYSKGRCFRAATLASDREIKEGAVKEHQLAAATKELERTFTKADFKTMQVLGQFNLGFILGKLEDDIYIIDQHASDEKFNYERLLKSTVLNRQPLLQPLALELSAVEEVIVIDHMETFRQNGFDFIQNEEASPGQRLGLSAIPFSKNVCFGVGDVQELISLLADSPGALGCGSHQHDRSDQSEAAVRPSTKFGIRPSRVRGMLASRACRSSIMIGDALSKREMERVLFHLADLDSPWNCPHGRPTMRHLAYLPALRK